MPVAEQLFRDFLRQRHLKLTVERVSILKTVQDFGRPFEAEELLLQLRDADQRISKATVYRTLKHLQDAGLIKQFHLGSSGSGGSGGKQAHYDFVDPSTGGAGAHDHLLDLETGKIVPFSSDLVVKLREEIAKKMGFKAISHRFQINARREMPQNGTEDG